REEPVPAQLDLVVRRRGDLVEQGAALDEKIAETGTGRFGATRGRRAPEAPGPDDPFQIEPRGHVERASRVAHPPERRRDDAGSGQRNEVRGGDVPAVPQRAAVVALRP